MLNLLDSFLIDKVCQPIVNFFHNHYSLNHKHLEAILYVIACLASIYAFGPTILEGVYSCVVGWLVWRTWLMARQVESNLNSGKIIGMNPDRINPFGIFVRYFFICLAIFDLGLVFFTKDFKYIETVSLEIWTVATYIGVCYTRPRLFKRQTSSAPIFGKLVPNV